MPSPISPGRVIGALLGGALANVLIAWACAVWMPEPPPAVFGPSSVSEWPGPTPRDWPTPGQFSGPSGQLGEARSTALGMTDRAIGGGTSNGDFFTYLTRSVGLPWRALRVDVLTSESSAPGVGVTSHVVSSLRQGIPLNARSSSPRSRLPLLPVWSGFTLNTLLYGGALLAVMHTGHLAVREARRRSGRCRGCGYLARGLDRCPECGHPVSARAPGP
jgi:hypothetical protein